MNGETRVIKLALTEQDLADGFSVKETVTFMIEEELRRLDEQMRELSLEGKLSKCRCGWPRMRKRLEDGSVLQFCNNRECPDFRENCDGWWEKECIGSVRSN